MEPIIKSQAEATRDQATLRAQQSPSNIRGCAGRQAGVPGHLQGSTVQVLSEQLPVQVTGGQGALAEVVAEEPVAVPCNEKQLCLGMWSNWFGIPGKLWNIGSRENP